MAISFRRAYYLTDDFDTPDDGILLLLVGIEVGFRGIFGCRTRKRGEPTGHPRYRRSVPLCASQILCEFELPVLQAVVGARLQPVRPDYSM